MSSFLFCFCFCLSSRCVASITSQRQHVFVIDNLTECSTLPLVWATMTLWVSTEARSLLHFMGHGSAVIFRRESRNGLLVAIRASMVRFLARWLLLANTIPVNAVITQRDRSC